MFQIFSDKKQFCLQSPLNRGNQPLPILGPHHKRQRQLRRRLEVSKKNHPPVARLFLTIYAPAFS